MYPCAKAMGLSEVCRIGMLKWFCRTFVELMRQHIVVWAQRAGILVVVMTLLFNSGSMCCVRYVLTDAKILLITPIDNVRSI